MLIVRAEHEGQRANRLGGRLHCDTSYSAAREVAKARRWLHYRRGLALELLQDFERIEGLTPDHSERMIAAATLLIPAALPAGGSIAALTPPKLIQSRTCQFWVSASLEPTANQLLANLNPAPNLVIRGFLTQRFSLNVLVDSVGTGALGSTTLKFSFDGGLTFPISTASGTTFTTSADAQQLVLNGKQTGIWVSCGAGPYDALDAWVSRIASLADQARTATGRDFIAQGINVVATMFDYKASNSAIRNRASMASDAARSTYFSTAYIPPDPGVTPSFVSWTGNASAFVNTGRIWGTGTVNQFCVRQANPTPTIAQAGAAAVNSTTAMTIGVWGGCEASFFDSTADRLRIFTTDVGPAAAGGCQSGVPNSGFTLGARAVTAALPSTYEFADIGLWTGGEPTATELRQSRAWKILTYAVAA